jgi:hypothetical protein
MQKFRFGRNSFPLTVFVVLALIMSFLVQHVFAMPISTSTTEPTLEATSSSIESVIRLHQKHLQQRSDQTQTHWLWIIFCGTVGIFLACLLGWACFFGCSKSGGKRTGQEREKQRAKASANEEVSMVVARELRRGSDERSQNRRDDRGQSRNEQPNANGALGEMQRMGEGEIEEIRLGIGIKRVPPVANPSP